jgi:hypothetical protein
MQQAQRISHCSFCRRSGHNRLTCIDQRLLDFETDCSIRCQSMHPNEFNEWLCNSYGDQVSLLKTFVAKKCRISMNRVDVSVFTNAITHYIYETYIFQYNQQQSSRIESELLSVLIQLRNPSPGQMHPSPELQNEIQNAILFLEMTGNIVNLDERERKFAIKSTLQPIKSVSKNEVIECCICFESFKKKDFIVLKCGHEFCNDCLKKSLVSDKRVKPCCAYCRTEIEEITCRTKTIHKQMTSMII